MSMSVERAAFETESSDRGSDEIRIPGRWSMLLRVTLSQRRVLIGLAILVLLVAMAWIGPLLSPWGFEEHDYTSFLTPPSPEHWLGTDSTGRDLYTITLIGLRKSIIIGLLVAIITTGVAAVVGAFAGYFLGLTDKALMWVTDLALILPSFLILVILLPAAKGGGWLLFVLLLAAFGWMITAKMVRGTTISLKEREYVYAARYMGVSPVTIIFRHIIPNMSSLLIVDATINVSSAIIAETSLSYFGFGVQSPDISLGTLIATGARHAATHPWTFVFCTGLLIVLVMAVNLVGEGLRDAFDPRARIRLRKNKHRDRH